MVKLYKEINGRWVHVDYGVPSKADSYAQQGYIVVYPGIVNE